jgi:hypothetical protein
MLTGHVEHTDGEQSPFPSWSLKETADWGNEGNSVLFWYFRPFRLLWYASYLRILFSSLPLWDYELLEWGRGKGEGTKKEDGKSKVDYGVIMVGK